MRMRPTCARSRERMAGAAPGAIMDEDYFGSAAEWGDEADGGQVRGGAGRPRRGLLVSVAGGPAPPPPRPAPRSPCRSSTACPAPSPPRSAPPAPPERPPPAFAPGPPGPTQSAAASLGLGALRCKRVGAGAGAGGLLPGVWAAAVLATRSSPEGPADHSPGASLSARHHCFLVPSGG